jgi:hypothetical protein
MCAYDTPTFACNGIGKIAATASTELRITRIASTTVRAVNIGSSFRPSDFSLVFKELFFRRLMEFNIFGLRSATP